METILLRRRHREGQAWGLVRAAVREVESRTATTTDTTAAEGGTEGTKGGKRGGARTLEALHAKVCGVGMCGVGVLESDRIGSD